MDVRTERDSVVVVTHSLLLPVPCLFSFFIWTSSISRVIMLWEGWDIFWVHWPKSTNTA